MSCHAACVFACKCNCEYLPGDHVYKYSINESNSVRCETNKHQLHFCVFSSNASQANSRVLLYFLLYNSTRDLIFVVVVVCFHARASTLGFARFILPRKRRKGGRFDVVFSILKYVCENYKFRILFRYLHTMAIEYRRAHTYVSYEIVMLCPGSRLG